MPKLACRALLSSLAVCALHALGPAAVATTEGRADGTDALVRRRTPFVIGAPGRLDAEGDRRDPRRYQRADSALAAYADVEQVEDPTWLRHEVDLYARRTVDCAGTGPPWCTRETRRLAAGAAIFLASGAHAELVWVAGRNIAVRLGWRRIVDTPTGSLTLDAPPADFASALAAEFPSRLIAGELDAGDDGRWAANEIDRLLYYVDQVVAGLAGVARDEHRRHAVRFIEDDVAQIARLRARYLGPDQEPTREVLAAAPTDALPPALAEQLAALHAWRGLSTSPWCTAQLASSAWAP